MSVAAATVEKAERENSDIFYFCGTTFYPQIVWRLWRGSRDSSDLEHRKKIKGHKALYLSSVINYLYS